MAQPLFARGDLAEGPEVHDPLDHPLVDLPNLRIFRQPLDKIDRLLSGGWIGGSHLNRPIVLNVNAGASLGGDSTDHLAAGSNQLTDLLRIDLEQMDPRRIGREVRSRGSNACKHLLKHVSPGRLGLLEGVGQNLEGESLQLHIQLQRGNPVGGTGHFKIHVTVVVLEPDDVSEHHVAIPFVHQTHRNSRDRSFNRHPGIHQGEGCSTDGRHRGGSVGFQDLRDEPNGVRKSLLRRHDRP